MNAFSQNPFQTRDDLARAVQDLVTPLLPYFSKGCTRIRLGGAGARHDVAASEMESFTRPLWGLAPLSAGGFAFEHWQLWRTGLVNGCDPNHPEYWGDIVDVEQRLVELAAVGFAMLLAKKDIWQPLNDDERQIVIAYLRKAHQAEFANCNWKFFRILIGMGLRSVGVVFSDELDQQYLDEIDEFYLGEGWYRDGPNKHIDHYVPFAMHYYGLFFASFDADETRAQKYKERASEFAQDLVHWYHADGSSLPFGRSLAYRFAHAGFWGALPFSGVKALPWGQLKGFYLRNLRWWSQQPIFERDGVLSVGFAYPNLLMAEGYNGPGSPYWALKAFLPLALGEDHPFWQAEEVKAPELTSPKPLPKAGMVMQHTKSHAVALVSGPTNVSMRHVAEKYAKFAYSTRYGFSVETDERHFQNAVADNMLCLSADGRHFRFREENDVALMADDCLFSQWFPFEDVRVRSWLIPQGEWHLRVHEIHSARDLEIVEGGFSIAQPEGGAIGDLSSMGVGHVRAGADASVIWCADDRGGRVHKAQPNSNIMFARSLVPQIVGQISAGLSVLRCAVWAGDVADYDAQFDPQYPEISQLRLLFAEKGQPVIE